MKVVVIEDEVPARALLRRLLREMAPGAAIAAELDSVAAAREHFGRAPAPDLVLSDIRLSDGDALTLFEEGAVCAPVIFVTAHDAYVAAALAHLSIDYLLKPVGRADFARALARFERLRRHFQGAEVAEASALVGRRPRQRVLVRERRESRVLAVADVAYFKSDDRLTLAVERSGRASIIDRTLGELERELDPARFFRANRAFLVQVDAVAAFRSGGRGRLAVSLVPEPAEEVLVSQENAAAFQAFVDR